MLCSASATVPSLGAGGWGLVLMDACVLPDLDRRLLAVGSTTVLTALLTAAIQLAVGVPSQLPAHLPALLLFFAEGRLPCVQGAVQAVGAHR